MIRRVVQATKGDEQARVALERLGWVLLCLIIVWAFAVGQRAFYAELLVPMTSTAPGDELVFLQADEIANLNAAGLSVATYASWQVSFYIIFLLVHGSLATLIFWRRPDDRMARFVALTMILWGGNFPGVPQSLWHEQPLIAILLTIGSTVSGFCFYVFLFLFPNGRFVPFWMRWVVIGVSVCAILGTLPSIPSLLPTALARWLVPLQLIAFIIALGAVIGSQLYRYRRISSPHERQQTRWVLLGIVVGLGCVMSVLSYLFFNPDTRQGAFNKLAIIAVIYSGFLAVPISIGIAIMRSQLWDIDSLLSRTLVYGLLTGSVVAIYVLLVGSLSTLFQREGSLPIALVATGVVAVLFHPLRTWLQRGVNRLLYGERDDPYAIVTRLGQQLEQTLAPDAVLPTLVETVAVTLKLPYVAILLKQADVWQTIAAYGRQQENVQRFPLTYQGETVGYLLVAPRAPQEPFSRADQHLLTVLSQQAGVAAHAVRLTLDLQTLTGDLQLARERLVSAREEERRRIRRDLHDGVGPVLASLVQRIDVARLLVGRDPDAATVMLTDLKGEVRTTLADIRRLVYALRPPALDEFGLVEAIREQAAHHQSTGLTIAIETVDLPPLPAAVEVAAYRIALEGVTNVARHAAAQHCRIALSLIGLGQRQALCVEVIDDGVGLSETTRTGVGFASMRERAAELNGVCTLERGPKGGTRVCAWLPLALEEEE